MLVELGLVVLMATLLLRERDASKRAARAAAEADIQRQTITRMQRALLPETAPAIAGLSVGWHYQTGGEQSDPVGGDWLAFVPFAPDCLAIAIGDVAGHGIAAVSAMAQYRFALRAFASTTTAPSAVLTQLDASARLLGIRHFSTCVFCRVSTTDATLTHASAGHLGPLLVRDGFVQQLPAPHGPPLAATGEPTDYTGTTTPLETDDVLAFYTDGLVERRGESIDTGIGRLGDSLLNLTTTDVDLRQVSTAIVDELTGSNPVDDVILILLRYNPAPADTQLPISAR
jgi:serine phosphatase RsbU (regulator of sigma subunit)